MTTPRIHPFPVNPATTGTITIIPADDRNPEDSVQGTYAEFEKMYKEVEEGHFEPIKLFNGDIVFCAPAAIARITFSADR